MAGANPVGPLNQAQRDAITAPFGASLTIAGPGSGKTKVLTTRIAYLIKTHKQKPSSIVAITFTNRASMEMQTRLTSILGPEMAKQVTIGTFHSFGSRLLRTAGRQHLQQITSSASITEGFTIWDQDDCLRLTKDLMAKTDISAEYVKPALVLNALCNLREARIMAQTAAAEKGEYADHLSLLPRANKAANKIVQLYEDTLRASNALDFQDLLLQSYLLLKVPEVAEECNARYKHVLVDEYQDTNVPQYEIVRLLSPNALVSASATSDGEGFSPRSLFCVGDQNQAIYSWRGARVGNMDQLQQDYPGIRLFGLRENYRCAAPITSVANAILGCTATLPRGHDSPPPSSELPAADLATIKASSVAEPVRLITTVDDDEQGRCIAKLIETLRTNPPATASSSSSPPARVRRGREMAVMYRTNAQSRVLEQMLVERGVSYVLLGGRRFYDRREVRDVLCFMRLLSNGLDRVSAKRALEEFGAGVGAKTLAGFFSWCDASSEHAAAMQSKGDVSVTAHLEALLSIYGDGREGGADELDEGEDGQPGRAASASPGARLAELLGPMPTSSVASAAASATTSAASVAAAAALASTVSPFPDIVDPTPFLGGGSSRAVRSLASFASGFLSLRSRAQASSLSALAQHIAATYVNAAYLAKISQKGSAEAEERAENVEELCKACEKYNPSAGDGSDDEKGCLASGSLARFLEEAALLADSAESEESNKDARLARGEDVIYLLTIHASKGLEFDVVFLTGCEEGVLPLTRNPEDAIKSSRGDRGSPPSERGYLDSDESDAVKEERRLAFVAVTRARSLLFLTTRQRSMAFTPQGAKIKDNKPSRFWDPLFGLDKAELVRLKWK